MRKIIGITGFKRCGKTTAGKELTHLQWARFSFAAPIKQMLSALGCPEEYINGDRKEEVWPPIKQTARYFQQKIGTEFGRQMLHKDVWVDITMDKIDRLPTQYDVVLDDCRFPNEVAAIRARGGLIIKIVRPGCLGDGHESESHVDSIREDIKFLNIGDIEELRRFIMGTAENYDSIESKQ